MLKYGDKGGEDMGNNDLNDKKISKSITQL